MQKLVKRLVSYSKSLQVTAPHIAYERSKLISDGGDWRYFFTTAPADLYDNRLYDVVQSPYSLLSYKSAGAVVEKYRQFPRSLIIWEEIMACFQIRQEFLYVIYCRKNLLFDYSTV
jgi:hypothetical protein